jgi:hypothetical protein
MRLTIVCRRVPVFKYATTGEIRFRKAYPKTPHFFQNHMPVMEINWRMEITTAIRVTQPEPERIFGR